MVILGVSNNHTKTRGVWSIEFSQLFFQRLPQFVTHAPVFGCHNSVRSKSHASTRRVPPPPLSSTVSHLKESMFSSNCNVKEPKKQCKTTCKCKNVHFLRWDGSFGQNRTKTMLLDTSNTRSVPVWFIQNVLINRGIFP